MSSSSSRVRADSLEFPILAKYYLPFRKEPARIFASGGYVFGRLWKVKGTTHASGYNLLGERFDSTYEISRSPRSTHGLAVGGGVRWVFGKLHLAPEVRLTHWTSQDFLGLNGYLGPQGAIIRINANQWDLLFSVMF